MPSLKTTLRRVMTLGRVKPATARPRRALWATPIFDNLEARVVLSSVTGGGPGGTGTGTGTGSGSSGSTGTGGTGGMGGGCGGGMGGGIGGGTGGSSSVLAQDAAAVSKAYATFNVSYQSAVTALRATATTTSVPTPAGLAAFDSALSMAIGTLDSTIATDLKNLTNTGTAVASTIDGDTATLLTDLEGAGTGLKNSTNASVNALYQESAKYVTTASAETTQAILSDTTAASLTQATIQSADQAVAAAFQAFDSSIETAVAGGTSLSTSAVSSAITALQTALTAAEAKLGTAFTASTYSPAAAITAELTTLTSKLTGITATTARSFASQVNTALMQGQMTVDSAIATAISGYNSSLL